MKSSVACAVIKDQCTNYALWLIEKNIGKIIIIYFTKDEQRTIALKHIYKTMTLV